VPTNTREQLKKKKKIIVGVNQFTSLESSKTPVFKIDEQVQTSQIEKLNQLKKKRDANNVASCLNAIEKAARSKENLMPVVIEAVEHYCTLGEISDTLRKVFGEHRQ